MPEQKPARTRPVAAYAALAILAAITVSYHVRLAKDILKGETVHVPFFVPATASAAIESIQPEAVNAGLRRGDWLLSVNGRPYTGTAVLSEEMAKARPGDTIALRVRTGTNVHTVELHATPDTSGVLGKGLDFLLHFAVPIFCMVVGFWAVIARPRDPLAWILLGLMISFPHIFEARKIPGWGPGWREVAMTFNASLGDAWCIFMYLFGLYFPEPFPKRSRWTRIWKAILWLGVLPFLIYMLPDVVISVREMSDYAAMAGLQRALQPVFADYVQWLAYVLAGSFFAAISIKASLAMSVDARRRLRLLYWGATIAMTPALILTVVARIMEKAVVEAYPKGVVVAALALLALFPMTMAYVIIVQRAMDVRMVLRQGLQYGLAKGGIRTLQVLLSAIVIIAAATLASDTSRNRPQKLPVISIGIVGVLTIRRAAEKLRAWTDRRFFREAYNAEQVLTELSDQVRTMVEPRSLLETVSTRVAETLHVQNIAVLLRGSEIYQPAYALGYGVVPEISFPASTATVTHLRQTREPARVYLEDPNSWIYTEPAANNDERSKLAELHTELLLPLAVSDKLLGFISLGPKKSEEPYSGSDVRLLKSVAAQTGLALENANLMRAIADEVAQRERLNREVEIAREVQERLFPQKLPEIHGLDYAGHCRPALGVGGDYYDFLGLPEGHLGVAIGDVSGKGIAAALMMASLQASLRGEATRAPENLAAAIANINRLVYEASSENRYATFFYGQYDPATRRFDYVNAGHNPPMLFHRTKTEWQLSRLDVGGTVVGLLESFPYQQGCATLAPGDILVAFTDGISEAMNSADEEWGEERLIQTVKLCAGLGAGEMQNRIFEAADVFVAGAKQHDDMTLVILHALL